MAIPFRTLDCHLKCIRAEDQSFLAENAMRFAMADFFQNTDFHSTLDDSVKQTIGIGKISGKPVAQEQPFTYRRFSGGAQLPRGRYYSVSDSSGDDGFALEYELKAYVNHRMSGRILIKDAIAKDHTPHLIRHWTQTDQPNAIWLKFLDTEGYRNPFVTWLVDNKHLQNSEDFEIALPYRLDRVKIDKIIDLRYPETQDWLYKEVKTGLQGTGLYYRPNHLVSALTIRGDRPTESELSDKLKFPDGTDRLMWYGAKSGWDEIARDGPENFFGLLPFLLFPGRGGSPITEAIGRSLILAEANGLVFPSARSDIECEHSPTGELVCSRGWNFVDYRDAPSPVKNSWIIIDPDSWWDLPVHTDIRSGDDGISWWVVGTARSQFEEFRYRQLELMLPKP